MDSRFSWACTTCPFKPLCMFTVFNMSVAKDTALTCFIKLFHFVLPHFWREGGRRGTLDFTQTNHTTDLVSPKGN